ncbi:MAG: efflux RND transporter permease subunit, partial [Myxococcota bacterium]
PHVNAVVERLRDRLRSDFPGVEFSFDTGGMLTAALNFGEPAPIHYQVMGSDLETLDEIGSHLVRSLKGVDGAEDVRVLQRNDYPTLNIQIDRTKAATAGLNVEDIMHNLVTATNSSINFRPAFWIDESNGNHYFIGAQYREADHVSADTMLDIPLTPDGGGEPVPLRTVATIERGTGPSFVSHRDITRVVDIYANVSPDANMGDVVAAMEERLEADEKLGLTASDSSKETTAYDVGGDYAGRGYTLTASGEIQTMRASFLQYAQGLGLAIILVYLVMVAQFRSFRDPLLILATIPLGFIGVALALYGTGTPLSIQAFMGIIMMVGIVVEYGILLVDFANKRVEEGTPVRDAILQASALRLRPILMTSLTTVLALVPMALGLGGAEVNAPLARAIIGGVLAATVLTLFVLPGLYVMVKRPRSGDSTEGERTALAEGASHA